jgi:hypothetical protein
MGSWDPICPDIDAAQAVRDPLDGIVERTSAETLERRPVMTSGFKAKAALSERGDDLYETPAVAVTALLERETLPSVVWEPACGRGAIVGVFRAAGHTVIATDRNDWGAPIPNQGATSSLSSEHPMGASASSPTRRSSLPKNSS